MALTVRSSGFAATGGPDLLTGEPYVSSDSEFWVDSVTGNDSNAGTEKAPKATVFGASGAIASCTTGQSNLVICKATHRETIGSAYTWSKTGITLVSFGSGTARAQFTNADIITMSGGDTRLENLYFPAASAAIARKINITGVGVEMRDCQFELGASEEVDGVLVNAVADATFRGCTFKVVGTTTLTTRCGLRITGAATNALVEECTFDGGSYGWSSGYACKVESATTDRFRLRKLTLQNYSFAGCSTSGAKGYFGGGHVIDATSGWLWTE